jgi:hypothetical protein
MSCNPCDPCYQGHVPATLSSPLQTIAVDRSGVDLQTFTIDINPANTAQALAQSPAATATLCAALSNCLNLTVELPLVGEGTPSDPLRLLPLGTVNLIISHPPAMTLLCDAIRSCVGSLSIDDIINYGTDPAGFPMVVVVNPDTIGIRRLVAGPGIVIVQQPDGSLRIEANYAEICAGLTSINCAVGGGGVGSVGSVGTVGVGTVGVGTVGVGTVGVGTVGVGTVGVGTVGVGTVGVGTVGVGTVGVGVVGVGDGVSFVDGAVDGSTVG